MRGEVYAFFLICKIHTKQLVHYRYSIFKFSYFVYVLVYISICLQISPLALLGRNDRNTLNPDDKVTSRASLPLSFRPSKASGEISRHRIKIAPKAAKPLGIDAPHDIGHQPLAMLPAMMSIRRERASRLAQAT